MTIEENSKANHPEGLLEGLRQSAAGEVVDLGSFEQYIPIKDRKVGEIFELPEDERKAIPNGENYDRFTVEIVAGEKFAVAVRPGIVANYSENDYGYLIQETEAGFRFIGIDAGEDDYFGDYQATQQAAAQAALADWKSYNAVDYWGWTKALREAAEAPDASKVEAIASVLIEDLGADLHATDIQTLAVKIAKRIGA